MEKRNNTTYRRGTLLLTTLLVCSSIGTSHFRNTPPSLLEEDIQELTRETETPIEDSQERLLPTSPFLDTNTVKIQETCPGNRIHNRSRAIGKPNHGRLKDGVRLKPSDYLEITKPKNSYGIASLVNTLDRTACILNEEYNTPLRVYSLSKETGRKLRKISGVLGEHLSHQNGIDVDIGIYRTTRGKVSNNFKKLKRGEINNQTFEANWYLIRTLQESGNITYIFSDRRFIKSLKGYVLKEYGKENWTKYGRVLQHSKGHKDHFHIRVINDS